MEIRSRSIRLLSSMVLLMAVIKVSTSRRDRQSSFSSADSGVLQNTRLVTIRTHFNARSGIQMTKVMFEVVCC